jgi:hypothetical protein
MVDDLVNGFLALLIGFVNMVVPVFMITGFLQSRVPEWVGEEGSPRPAYVAVNLFYSFLAAVGGGFVTALIAHQNALDTALALAIVILVLGTLSTLQAKVRPPLWYQVPLLIVSPLGVIAGGLLRIKFLGNPQG